MPASTKPLNWVDEAARATRLRRRRLDAPVPTQLEGLPASWRQLLSLWVAADGLHRTRQALLKQAGAAHIEQAEALCDWLLEQGWIVRKERLEGGRWQWQALNWRDLDMLKQLLGVGSRQQRAQQKAQLLQQAQQRLTLQEQGMGPEQAALLEALQKALDGLSCQAASLTPALLQRRLRCLSALLDWVGCRRQGTRRDFSLHALGATKALGAGDWRWLAQCVDLEACGVTAFEQGFSLAGPARLHLAQGVLDLQAAAFLTLPLADVQALQSLEPLTDAKKQFAHWWLIENRASFERQCLLRRQAQCRPANAGQASAAQDDAPGLLVWLPGRPSQAWLQAMQHLLRLAPAPLRISADIDPAGVDIACTLGSLWQQQGLTWQPWRMGAAELEGTPQRWALNDYDRALLQQLLLRPQLPLALRQLCQAMQRMQRKAEQEAWL